MAPLPFVGQRTCFYVGRTLAGDTPDDVSTTLESAGVAVLGANCSLGPQGLLEILRELGRHTALPLSALSFVGFFFLVLGFFFFLFCFFFSSDAVVVLLFFVFGCFCFFFCFGGFFCV